MPTTAEYRRLSAILREMERRKNLPPKETEPKEFSELRKQEEQILFAFFEKKITVPPLPSDVTLDKMKTWERQGFKLHYLPQEDMKKNKHLQAWKKQPNYTQYLEASKLPADLMILKEGWALVDTRQKPTYDNGNQMYQHDILAPVLAELRKNIIQNFKHPSSRFNLSSDELENPEVLNAFAEAYGVKPNQITIQKSIEFNVLGNIHHPEWGKPPSNCSEWFSDLYDSGQYRLDSGNSDGGGLSYVSMSSRDSRHGGIGFRALVRFSQ